MQGFKPLLASAIDLDKIEFPLDTSPKLDGIRAMMLPDEGLVSRKLKAIPNEYIRTVAEDFPAYIDGEIITFTDGKLDDFNTIQSKVMKKEGTPDFQFVIFDWFGQPNLTFAARSDWAREACALHYRLDYLEHERVTSLEELMAAEAKALADKHEGLMIRRPDGQYKFGRSTAKEQILLKMKRFLDDEAVIVGKVELMHNENEQTRDALGNAKRSSSKEGKVPAGVLGTLRLRWNEVEFEVGTGFDAAQRAALWSDDSIIGQKATFKYQEVSPKGVPRFPVFLGIRRDL